MSGEQPVPASRPPHPPRTQRCLFAALPIVVLTSCGHEASVDLRNGDSIDGTILGSDKERLTMERDNGRPVAIARETIDYIDYPGNVLQIAGGLTMLIGASIAGNMPDQTASGAAYRSAVVWGPGLVMLAWGTYLNFHSRALARNLTREQERIDNSRPYLPAPTYAPAPSYAPAPITPRLHLPPEEPPAPSPVPMDAGTMADAG